MKKLTREDIKHIVEFQKKLDRIDKLASKLDEDRFAIPDVQLPSVYDTDTARIDELREENADLRNRLETIIFDKDRRIRDITEDRDRMSQRIRELDGQIYKLKFPNGIDLEENEIASCKANRHIEAIKAVRERLKIDLKTAKDAVDAWRDKNIPKPVNPVTGVPF